MVVVWYVEPLDTSTVHRFDASPHHVLTEEKLFDMHRQIRRAET